MYEVNFACLFFGYLNRNSHAHEHFTCTGTLPVPVHRYRGILRSLIAWLVFAVIQSKEIPRAIYTRVSRLKIRGILASRAACLHLIDISECRRSPLNLSLSQRENTQTLGAARFKPSARFIHVKTKRYMPYHRNVIYNPSNIQLQKPTVFIRL